MALFAFHMPMQLVPESDKERVTAQEKETPLEAFAGTCSVLVIGLFVLTFIFQNFVIPSGSMENTLLIGDHLAVDRVTLAPEGKWMPLVHYRAPQRGDVVVFLKPVPNSDGKYLYLVKRLIGVPGDRLHLHQGVVYINGVAQQNPLEGKQASASDPVFTDEFPAVAPVATGVDGVPAEWAVSFPNHVKDGDLVVPEGQYFMMGDNRHNSLDSRYWGFVPRENILGRPLINYWSFEASEDSYQSEGIGNSVSRMANVVLHFFPGTRWSRTFKIVR